MTGPSARIDRLHEAVRADLADIRLAERVFAPHYAQAVERVATCAVAVRVSREAQAEQLGMLQIGDVFEVLEFSDGQAWGVAPALGVVGYVDTDCVSWVAPDDAA